MTDRAAVAEREGNLESLVPKVHKHSYLDDVVEEGYSPI